MSNINIDDTEIKRIASEINRYLGNHPHGGDTIDGITRWWIPRQRIEETSLLVQQALDYLVSESRIERKTSPDGRYLYFGAAPLRDDK
ncbi:MULTISPECIES: hypothetical protein [Neptunomonas]|uniref:Uncharacterized protein n=1 Tax=Neptunomonas qingdaonensis TaxID=1045558 RepID=A0A1I2PJ90_9GAMM|nr:hypothetical protein [Neptunomonas qingdaonensis]SFG14057.1 hypothetical protein SAMN05216175_103398 [Neptunomonas qingdaonensis]